MAYQPGEGNRHKTTDDILEEIKNSKDIQRTANPTWYLDKAEALAFASGAEEDLLADLRSKIAGMKLDYLRKQEKRNVSEAELWTEAQPEYLEFRKQETKVDRIKEIIRIYKHTAESLTRGF